MSLLVLLLWVSFFSTVVVDGFVSTVLMMDEFVSITVLIMDEFVSTVLINEFASTVLMMDEFS